MISYAGQPTIQSSSKHAAQQTCGLHLDNVPVNYTSRMDGCAVKEKRKVEEDFRLYNTYPSRDSRGDLADSAIGSDPNTKPGSIQQETTPAHRIKCACRAID